MADKKLKITLRKSGIGFDKKQKLVVQGLMELREPGNVLKLRGREEEVPA